LICASAVAIAPVALADPADRGLGSSAEAPAWAESSHIHFLARPRPPASSSAPLLAPSLLGATHTTLGRRCEPEFCPAVPLLYEGGRGVQHAPHVFVILWGANWTATPGSAVATQLLAMYRGLESSAWQGVLSQYFDATGRVSSTVAVTAYTDTAVAAPSSVSDAKLRAEVAHAIATQHWSRSFDDQFAVIPAPGSTYQSGFDTGFCGYHGTDEQGSSYAFVPYTGDQPFRSCNGYDPHANAANATSTVASHEYAESATDPVPGSGTSTWVDKEGWEVADICASGDDELPDGSFVQGLWDDHAGACSLSDPSPPHVYAITGGASQVSASGVSVFGTLDAEGLETHYHFEYGASTAYGASVPVPEASAAAGSATQDVEQTIGELTPGATYHYRLVATNSSGTTAGEDATFKVVQRPPELRAPANTTISPGAVVGFPGTLEPGGRPSQSVNLTNSKGAAVPVTVMHWESTGLILRFAPSTPPGSYQLTVADQAGTGTPLALTLSVPTDAAQALTPVGDGSAPSLPRGVAEDLSGDVWFADAAANAIGEMLPDGSTRSYPLASRESDPAAIAVDQAGDVWVADRASAQVTELDVAAALAGSTSGETSYALAPGATPQAIGVDPYGSVWVAEGDGVLARIAAAAPGATRSVEEWLLGPAARLTGLSVDALGDVWLIDAGSGIDEVIPSLLGAPGLEAAASAGVYRVAAEPHAAQLAAAADGNVWFAGAEPPLLGTVTPSPDGPPADQVLLAEGYPADGGSPTGLGVDAGGSVFLTDAAAQALYRFLPGAGSGGTLAGEWSEFRVGSWLADHPGVEPGDSVQVTPAGTVLLSGYATDGPTSGPPLATGDFVQGFVGQLPGIASVSADPVVDGVSSQEVVSGTMGTQLRIPPGTSLTTAAGTPFAGTIPAPAGEAGFPAPAGLQALAAFAVSPVLSDGVPAQVRFSAPVTITFSFALPAGVSAEQAAATEVFAYDPTSQTWGLAAGSEAGDRGGSVTVAGGVVHASVRTTQSSVFAVAPPLPPVAPVEPDSLQPGSSSVQGSSVAPEAQPAGAQVLSFTAPRPQLTALAVATTTPSGRSRMRLRMRLHASVAGQLTGEIVRRVAGVRLRGRCRAAGRAPGPRCTRSIAVAAVEAIVAAGADTLVLRLPALAPGTYLLTLTLTGAGGSSTPLGASFRVAGARRSAP